MEEQNTGLTMDEILKASFGETSSTIKATFRKTVRTKEYETEVVEIESVVDMRDRQLTGAERMLVSALLQVQLEYQAYCNLVYKGLITAEEFTKRKHDLEEATTEIKKKAETIIGQSMDKYFNIDL